jgi:predicted dehydrogenase
MQITRKRGAVVVVGEVGLNVPRSPFYEKEIDLRISCSYGPGRYDPEYEERGVDYPAAYVRWTENRNMEAYLELLRDGSVDWNRLVDAAVPVEDAPSAFSRLASGTGGLAFTLRYAGKPPAPARQDAAPVPAVAMKGNTIRLGVIGAGSFARAVHLGHLKALRHQFQVVAVATRRGVTAVNAARQAGAAATFTDYRELLRREDVDAVLVATRHDLHAEIATAALQAGKAVFLEKPLAIDQGQLDMVLAAARTSGRPLFVGFNRRFSSACHFLRERMARHAGPPLVSYRVNADRGKGSDDWTLGPEGGGRAIGEACHMVDFLHALADSPVTGLNVTAASQHGPPDANTVVQVTFGSGLVASLLYTTAGGKALGKERIEVFLGNEVAVVEDFRRGWIYGSWTRGPARRFTKGYREEWEAFYRVCAGESPPPMSLDVLRSVTETTFRIRELAYAACVASPGR